MTCLVYDVKARGVLVSQMKRNCEIACLYAFLEVVYHKAVKGGELTQYAAVPCGRGVVVQICVDALCHVRCGGCAGLLGSECGKVC